MRASSIRPFILGLATACGPDLPGTETASGGPETDASTSGASTSDDPGTSGDPGTSSAGTSSAGTSGVGPTTGDGSSGEPAQDPCLDALPAPTSCDAAPGACGNATPIAWAPDGHIHESALTAHDVWFIASRSGCPQSLYRVSRRGGDAEWIRSAVDIVHFEADAEAVYFLAKTEDTHAMEVSAWVDGAEAVIGEVRGDPRVSSDFSPALTRTFAGVVAHQAGAFLPSFSRLSPTGVTLLASAVEGASLGSAPAYDGERLFFTWSDNPFNDDGGPLLRKLVALSGDAWIELADGAAARSRPTVAVDATHVYFATGDPSKVNGDQPLPMNVARVATSGGPVTPLFPPLDVHVDAVLLDDDEVYFGVSPHDIFAVPKEGGEPRHVWHGYERGRLHLDATDLYFAVRGGPQELPVPGTTFVVRVAKDTALP